MKRREFITLLGGAAASWPVVAGAQQRSHVIGLLSASPASLVNPSVVVFRARMGELGWQDGRDIRIDVRSTAGNFSALNAEAEALIAAGAKVIVVVGTPALMAVTQRAGCFYECV